MKTILILPDSFKGTIPSTRVCSIIKETLDTTLPSVKILAFPVADGGEGTLDCFLNMKNAICVKAKTKNAAMKDITASYVIFDDTAVIETAQIAGFSLFREFSDPLHTTTYGLGLLVRDALSRNCQKIILALGGSCTNDGGAGLAAALGTKFFNADGKAFLPTGCNLAEVCKIDTQEAQVLLKGITCIGMCDVTNPMHGENGAAYVFAPQKGASPDDVLLLDNQLKHFANTIEKSLGINVSEIESGGAAGAMGAGIVAFLDGKLISGIDLLLELINAKKLLQNADLVITGEGRFDTQSLEGKAVSGISAIAKENGVPAIVVTGSIGKNLPPLEAYGIVQVFKTDKINFHRPHTEILMQAENALRKKIIEISAFIKKILADPE